LEHSAVQEAAVVGFADKNELTRPAAYVVLRDGEDGSTAKSKELMEHLTSRLAAFKCPHSIEFVQQLPKTATGKIQRFKLRQASR
jgi:benzoate-CoA ligase